MFKFLKEKLKQAVDKITHKIEESSLEKTSEKPLEKPSGKDLEAKEEVLLEKPSGKNLEVKGDKHLEKALPKECLEENQLHRAVDKIEKAEHIKKKPISEIFDKEEKLLEKASAKSSLEKSSQKEDITEKKEEKHGFFGKLKEKITSRKIDEKEFNEIFWELELALLENNVAVEVIEKIKADLKKVLVDKPIERKDVDGIIFRTLKISINDLFSFEQIDLIDRIKKKKDGPFVIVFFGLNGSGKTTTIAKFASILNDEKISCVLVAADTWRQAAIEQLEEHGKRLGLKVIKHNYGSDPAAVAFDGIEHARSKKLDAVLIDTAGRLHSNANLMQEMKKIVKVAKPDIKIFVGESITGNDCVEQASKFDEAVGIDGVILTKADVDEKGGAAVSIGYVIKKPILYLGVGQNYSDLKKFNKEEVMSNLGIE